MSDDPMWDAAVASGGIYGVDDEWDRAYYQGFCAGYAYGRDTPDDAT